MAVATGLAVASNYYVQPLLHAISVEFGLGTTQAGALVTAAQLSYAAGLILLVPLGDLLEKRGLIVGLAVLASIGLFISAFAPSIEFLFLGTAITGLFTVTAQVLVPFAATLAAPAERGKVVGMVMSGLLIGILIGRTVAGVLAQMGSWRTVYWVAAVLMLGMSALLYRALPRYRVALGLSYFGLLRSVGQIFLEEPLFRARALLSGLMFALFSVFWTSMTFLLSAQPYGFNEAIIGAFGLAGVVGAYAATLFGRLADKGRANASTRIALLLAVLSWGLLAAAPWSLVALVAGIIVLDLAVQGIHITNQSTIYRLRPEARSRMTSGYMTSCFVGGAAGSLASAAAYAFDGWAAVVALGVVLSMLTAAFGVFAKRAKIPENITSSAE